MTNLVGTRNAETLVGTNDADIIKARGGNDVVQGGDGNDVLRGQGGNDTLEGGAGSDILRGGRGDDFIDGGEGDDTFVGGSGADQFVLQGGGGYDTILDFDLSEDTLVFASPVGSSEGYVFDAISLVEEDGSLIIQNRGTDTQLNGVTIEEARDLVFTNITTDETFMLPDYVFLYL